jgi:RND family efflux transporter MFP subunit
VVASELELAMARFMWLVGQIGRYLSSLLLLVGLGLLMVWLSGYFQTKVQPSWTDRTKLSDPDAETDEVHEVVKPVLEEVVGTLRAANRTVVSAKILATIAEIPVVAGQEVRAGDVLIRLDAQEYSRRLEQARESLLAAIATEELAVRDFSRIEQLVSQNAVSRSEYDSVASRLGVAQAERRRSEQMVAESEVLLSYQTILAPKDGRIVDRYAEPGDMAQPGITLLSMYDAASLRLETPVMEQLAARLKVGDQLVARLEVLDREVTATVREIVPQADAASRSFLVKSAIRYSPELYEGMFGRLIIPGGERRHLCLNSDAIVRIGQLEYVDVLLPNDHVERRLIRTGELGMPGRQEVLSGVEAGDRVLLRAPDATTATGRKLPATTSGGEL